MHDLFERIWRRVQCLQRTVGARGSLAIFVPSGSTVSFYDGESSNELWSWPQIKKGRSETMRRGLWITSVRSCDRGDARVERRSHGQHRRHWLVAITADWQVLFVPQTARNWVLPKGFAASSSGSLDWADAKRVRQRADAVGQSVVLLDVCCSRQCCANC